jgi:hypothetical protein
VHPVHVLVALRGVSPIDNAGGDAAAVLVAVPE